MNVLSLFDGMSCGMLAFMDAGVNVSKYDAFEINKYAIETSTKNFPNIIQHGDVFNADFSQFHDVDFLIGGSPCTTWSIAQSKNRETEAAGGGWNLFSQYVKALKGTYPKYFIYENNKSMSKAIRNQIRIVFGFNEICINSSLVSGQNRERLYWVGKRNDDGSYSKVNVEQPEALGIKLADVLDRVGAKELTPKEMNYMVRETSRGRNHFDFYYMHDATKDKSRCITANIRLGVPYNVCCEPVRIGTYPGSKCPECDSKQYRIYSLEGKAVTQCGQGGGLGAKTGLYAVPVSDNDRGGYAMTTKLDSNGLPIEATSGTDVKTYTVYPVKDGKITINGNSYPIKLDDGFYIIRRLTVNECKKLQTIPDWYEFPVSNTRAYQLIGNGWTVKVISHLIKSCLLDEGITKGDTHG